MSGSRKITVDVPEDLLREAQTATSKGVTATVREGLRLVAASKVYEELQRWRGKVKFGVNLKTLREDRR